MIQLLLSDYRKTKVAEYKGPYTIRPDWACIPSDFVKKTKMERGDFKTIITSNSIIFIWMDTKHVFLASNYHKDNEVVPILRRMKSGQRVTINYPQAIKDY